MTDEFDPTETTGLSTDAIPEADPPDEQDEAIEHAASRLPEDDGA